MGRNFLQILPSELTSNIFSRLSFRSVAISKCVCKSWLNLLNSNYFVIKPPPALVCLKRNRSCCTIFEIEDKDEAGLESHDLHYVPLTDFDIPFRISAMVCTAANGLLLLYSYILRDPENPVYICNPLTREYILLFPPKEYISSICFDMHFGFGVSEISGQYKVLCLGWIFESMLVHVYTLGTGTWRPVETGAASGLKFRLDRHVVCNGNIHWRIEDRFHPFYLICGFDIETECFSIFSPPRTLLVDGVQELNLELYVFRECLCICYTQDYEINIWLMKEYRVEESWTMEYKLSTNVYINIYCVYPIKVFKDGDILMPLNRDQFIFYANKTKTIQRVGMFYDANARYFLNAMIFTPNLFSLKSFKFENVISF